MVPLDKIRSDLKEIRYYYSRKAMLQTRFVSGLSGLRLSSLMLERVSFIMQPPRTRPDTRART